MYSVTRVSQWCKMYRNTVCDSALSLPGNYKAHVRMFHGNERSNDRIFPPLKKNSLPSIEEECCSTADSNGSSDLEWPLNIEGDLDYKTRERDGYGIDMLGGQFLEWRVSHGEHKLPPIIPRAITSHVRRARTTSPLHDPQRKRKWLSQITNPSATSVKMVSDSKPKVYAYPCAQYNNLKKTIESYYGAHYPDNKERAQKRPPSVSSHVSPQMFNCLILQHKQQLQSNEGAVYLKAGGPIRSHYIVHPDWHLEPVQ